MIFTRELYVYCPAPFYKYSTDLTAVSLALALNTHASCLLMTICKSDTEIAQYTSLQPLIPPLAMQKQLRAHLHVRLGLQSKA